MHHCIPGSFFQKTFGESYLFFFFFFGILFSSKIPKCSARLLAERVFSLMYSDSVFACQEESEEDFPHFFIRAKPGTVARARCRGAERWPGDGCGRARCGCRRRARRSETAGCRRSARR